MGKTAALGLKLLWTMGCPPTKVNTQTTHPCPSPKTPVQTHNTQPSIQIHLRHLFGTCLRGVLLVRISDYWKWISHFKRGYEFFPAFEFPPRIPAFSPQTNSCSYIPTPNILTALTHTHQIQTCMFSSLSLTPFLKQAPCC